MKIKKERQQAEGDAGSIQAQLAEEADTAISAWRDCSALYLPWLLLGAVAGAFGFAVANPVDGSVYFLRIRLLSLSPLMISCLSPVAVVTEVVPSTMELSASILATLFHHL